MARRPSDYTFQEHLERLKLPQAKLLTGLRARIRGLDGRVEERIHKRRIAYSLDRDFVVILPQPRKQCLMVKLLDARYDDPRRWVQTVPKTKGYEVWGALNRVVFPSKPRDLGYTMGLIKTSYREVEGGSYTGRVS